MSSDEIAAFEKQPHFRDGVELRRIDDEAKVAGLDVPGLDTYLDTASRLARKAG